MTHEGNCADDYLSSIHPSRVATTLAVVASTRQIASCKQDN
jgi:hypothetical protein